MAGRGCEVACGRQARTKSSLGRALSLDHVLVTEVLLDAVSISVIFFF